jgi:TRAP-type C4-dicarboxylate transport system substrate-binding protein
MIPKKWVPGTGSSLFFMSLLLLSGSPGYAQKLIKFATLAPEGSTWMKTMRQWDKELRKETNGELEFRIYAGGVAGDEKDVVRKIRLGQLHAGGFTGVGLGQIAPEVRVLDAPFLFDNTQEVDYIYEKFDTTWKKAFEKNGYVLLGWAEVGFVYFFTNSPVDDLTELKKIKMWLWEGDPIAEAAFQSLGVHPIPLSIADVMSSLQTGLIDGVYSSPLGVIALQWFTKTKYMYPYHLAHATGAVLISKKFFKELSPNHQKILLSTAKRHLKELTLLSREENKRALQTLKNSGLVLKDLPTKTLMAKYQSLGQQARQKLVGRVYSAQWLDQIEKALQEYRTK